MSGTPPQGSEKPADAVANIVVLKADDRQFGLVVEEINDTEEIVVKPLGKQLKGISTFAGATIMGDGRVALILDVMGLAQRAGVVTEVRDRALAEKTAQTKDDSDNRQALLLLQGPDNGRMAIPLALVARLEEFEPSAVEKAGGQAVVQYRDQILPLIALSGALPERRMKPRHPEVSDDAAGDGAKIHVVVYANHDKTVGLMVDRILDIVEANLGTERRTGRRGTLGSLVIQGRVTELLDVEGIIHACDLSFSEEQVTA